MSYQPPKPRRKKQGLSPGTLVYTGTQHPEKIIITAIHYNADQYQETHIHKDEIINHASKNGFITWINVEGLTDVRIVEEIGEKFQLHGLLLEDVLNVYQVPKLDDYAEDGVLFLTLNEFYFENNIYLKQDQLSFIIGKNFLITFQERPGDAFEPVRMRLRSGKGTIRKKGIDYLTYALIDALVDSYVAILDTYNEELLEVEQKIISNPKSDQLHKIHHLSKNLIMFRKSIAPIKDIVSRLIKDESGIVQASINVYLRDVGDHVQQLTNAIDTDREFLASLINTNLSNINNRMNEIMKVLTVISTIFIPLTFIVGVYGMNFENMPELQWHYGYYFLWGIILLIVAILVIIFRKNKWL